MNSAHWHLLLNHIPVLGIWFGLAWLLAAIVLRNPTMIRAGLVTFILCAALAIPVYLTGEPAEEIVEHLPGVSETIIEQHERIAKIALISIELLGALSLASFIVSWRQEKWLRPLSILSLVLGLLCGGIMGYTANLGGQIRHSEIRPGNPGGAEARGTESNPLSNTGQTGEQRERDED